MLSVKKNEKKKSTSACFACSRAAAHNSNETKEESEQRRQLPEYQMSIGASLQLLSLSPPHPLLPPPSFSSLPSTWRAPFFQMRMRKNGAHHFRRWLLKMSPFKAPASFEVLNICLV